ncbi:heme ABC transporter ATP-binding protein [Pseudomonas profundi]|uniref:heme ABC transporter ATP-binding protein n=1 Tax=Pseudomonas profundi TaxID=1981513 RepID=UPI00123B99F1|nr:heme ABC transporter ATP-binding protein [Pseudomonas profundi]
MLEAVDLSCARSGKTILSQVNFELRSGEVLAVLGTNGAGKSTLLGTLAGELSASAGQVRLAGRPLAQWPVGELATRLAVLPQASSLAFGFTAEEVVAMSRMPHDTGLLTDRRVVSEAMRAADVTHLAGRSYLKLSGGERQRVHLARVMAQIWETPGACLIMDEPTASLDLAHQQLILEQAQRIAAGGGAVLVVLHDLNLAARYAHRILLLDRGEVVALGTPWDVLQAERIGEVFAVAVQVTRHPAQDSPLIII